jgi:hypothetical protein
VAWAKAASRKTTAAPPLERKQALRDGAKALIGSSRERSPQFIRSKTAFTKRGESHALGESRSPLEPERTE